MTQRVVYTETDELVLVDAGCCGIQFGMPRRFYDARLKDGATWYCPNGHPRCYNKGKSKAERDLEQAKAEAIRLQARLDQERATSESLRRSRSALKGQVTKARTRAARTQCPVGDCKRTFAPTNMQRHVETEHPHWHPEPEAEKL